MATKRRIPAEPPRPPDIQLDLFPFAVVVETLDPRAAIGAHTAVHNLFRVRMKPAELPHLVFHDRHGWYCEVHGPGCAAVHLARTAGDAR